jgi:hypothetical protein
LSKVGQPKRKYKKRTEAIKEEVDDESDTSEEDEKSVVAPSQSITRPAPRQWMKCVECDYRHWSDAQCPTDLDDAPAAPQHVVEKRWSGTNTRSLITDLKKMVRGTEATIAEDGTAPSESTFDHITNDDFGTEDLAIGDGADGTSASSQHLESSLPFA